MQLWPIRLDRKSIKQSPWHSSRGRSSLQVELNDPHHVYVPNSIVKGQVVMVLPAPTPVSAVTLEFKAFVAVRSHSVTSKNTTESIFDQTIKLWSADSDADSPSGPPSNNDDTNHDGRSLQSSKADLEITEQCLDLGRVDSASGSKSISDTRSNSNFPADCAHAGISPASTASLSSSTRHSRREGSAPPDLGYKELPAGEHIFHFELSLAGEGLLTSIEFERGEIRYSITARLERPNKRPKESLPRTISVVCPVDVANTKPARSVNLVVHLGRRSKNKVAKIKFNTGRRGFLRGENISVKLLIQHAINVQTPSAIVITLARITRLSGNNGSTLTFRKDLAQECLPLYTDPHTFEAVIDANLRVPADALATMRHKLVTFQYMVEFVVDLSGQLDLTKYAHPDPYVPFIDTDPIKFRSGVISAWSEVTVGTYRSESPPTQSQVPMRNISSPARSSFVNSGRTPDSSYSQSNSHISVDQSSLSELRPSAPPRAGTDSPANFARHSPPPHSFEASTHTSDPSILMESPPCADDQTSISSKSQLARVIAEREAALLPSAPDFGSSMEPSAPVMPGTLAAKEQQPSSAPTDDKRELEYARLAAQATAPDDYEYVPVYEPNQGSS